MSIYIIVSEPYEKNQIKRHGLDFILEKHTIKIINLFLLNGETYSEQEINHYKMMSEKDQFFCNSTDEVCSILANIKATDIVIYHIASMHYKLFNYIIRHFNKEKIRYGFMAIMSIPDLNISFQKKCIFYLENQSYIFQKTLRRIYIFFKKPYFRPHFIIAAGDAVLRKNKATYGLSPKYFSVESIDYRNTKNIDLNFTKQLKNKKYILYIEQGVPFHPDLKLSKKEFGCDPIDYYKRINVFLTKIETQTKLEVIISLPPKTELFMPELTNFFLDRQIFINRTAELTKDCEFVLAQYSTAISCALIYKKPVILFSLSKDDYSFPFAKNLAKILGNEIVIVNEVGDDFKYDSQLYIYHEKRNRFIENWIKSDGAIPLQENIYFLDLLNSISK